MKRSNLDVIYNILEKQQYSELLKNKFKDFLFSLFYKECKTYNTVESYFFDIKLSLDYFISQKITLNNKDNTNNKSGKSFQIEKCLSKEIDSADSTCESSYEFCLSDVEKLTSWDFRSFYLYRKNKTNIKSVSQRRLISAWKSFFDFLGLKNILYGLKIKTDKTYPKPVELRNIEKLFEVKEGDWVSFRNRALWSLMYCSGMRISEVIALDIKHWTECKDSMRIVGKGNVERDVPILQFTKDFIDEYLNLHPYRKTQDSPLFFGKSGKRLNPQTAAHTIRRFRISNGISDNLTPHSLRHSFASHVLNNRCSLKDLQNVLGHKNLQTTSQYVEIQDKNLEESFMKIMDEDEDSI
ncbi:tyrosine-type recombinase/integrase [Candidatus Nesciobacter abundans]|uniref:Tyrosine-type recombinase/integrase n=1 Tax=Candidatus Nesciobacter abundans TaxID=2601668 RepID=A0A5C0UI08_9PROT|nr:tyrosine-type recombinase/integrase [Candidatus Nesciobacter abundans]QEK39012.1 tyrosine-type recombinase/integrase [Candidatus Nesciobacter abundans]